MDIRRALAIAELAMVLPRSVLTAGCHDDNFLRAAKEKGCPPDLSACGVADRQGILV